MPLDLTHLKHLRRLGDGSHQAQCPACFESDADKKGEHLRIYPDGEKYGCAIHPGDRAHRQRIYQLAGVDRKSASWAPPLKPRAKPAEPATPRPPPKLPLDKLELGTAEELQQLSEVRRITLPGLLLAQDRGVLRFADLEWRRGELFPAWWIVGGNRVMQARRLDGELWPFRNGPKKAYTFRESQAGWPAGIEAVGDRPVVLVVEGGPDLLAAHAVIAMHGAPDRVAAIGFMGAGMRFPDDALELLRGRRVRLFPHADEAGEAAEARWADALATVGCDVDTHDLGDYGPDVNDVNDLIATVNPFPTDLIP